MRALDATIAVVTPEGVTVEAVLADPIRRMWALLLDLLVLVVAFALCFSLVFWVLSHVGWEAGKAVYGLMLIAVFLLIWGYFALGEFLCGQTVGKWVLGIYVVNVDLTPLSFGAALWRNVLRYVDFMPFAFAVGTVFILASPRHQRFGDWLAGSVVVVKESRLRAYHSAFVRADWVERLTITPQPPIWALDYQGRLALLAFARFAPLTTLARAVEMSAPFAPLLPDLGGEARVARLLGYARFLERHP